MAGRQQILGEVIQKIGLILSRIHRPQQLVASGFIIVDDAGIVPRGDALTAQFFPGVLQHGAKLHRPVALGTGQRRDAVAVAFY